MSGSRRHLSPADAPAGGGAFHAAAATDSAVYVGTLHHKRLSPVVHEFTYPVFMVMLDVDRVPELMRVSRLTSYNRWNWASFHDGDHFGHPGLPLRERLESDARRRGLDLPDGPIFLLTHLRYLGYCFNPVSFYYCFDRQHALRLVVAEVNNTFGGTHNYWLVPEGTDIERVEPGIPPRRFIASAAKALYVSPFMEHALDYRFALTVPYERLVAHMDVSRPGERQGLFGATLSLERRPWTSKDIRRALILHPWMTARVMAGIHWEALRLWRKGVAVVPREHQRGLYGSETGPDWARSANERHP